MTESSHNLTGAKTILSVRAHRQHLFVLDKMILTLITILFSARSTSTTPPTVRCSVSSPENILPQTYYKIAASVQHSFIPICADALAAEWRLLWITKKDCR